MDKGQGEEVSTEVDAPETAEVRIPVSLIHELRVCGDALKNAGEALQRAAHVATDLETVVRLRRGYFERLNAKLDGIRDEMMAQHRNREQNNDIGH